MPFFLSSEKISSWPHFRASGHAWAWLWPGLVAALYSHRTGCAFVRPQFSIWRGSVSVAFLPIGKPSCVLLPLIPLLVSTSWNSGPGQCRDIHMGTLLWMVFMNQVYHSLMGRFSIYNCPLPTCRESDEVSQQRSGAVWLTGAWVMEKPR